MPKKNSKAPTLLPFLTSAPKGVVKKTKRCGYCKKLLDVLKHFDMRTVDGVQVPLSRCRLCRRKHNTSQAEYKKTPKGKATDAEYNKSDKCKASKAKHRQTDEWAATQARHRETDKFAEGRKRQNKARRVRHAKDPAYAMMRKVHMTATNIASGRTEESPTFAKRTSFKSASHFRSHLKKSIKQLPGNVKFSDHGVEWEIEHAIPQEAYDFSDKEDIKRCWSEANVRALPSVDNMQKSIKLIDSLCIAVGPQAWPKAWGGKLLTDDEKKAFYAEAQQSFQVSAQADEDDSDESDDDSDDESDDDSEAGDKAGPSRLRGGSDSEDEDDPDSDSDEEDSDEEESDEEESDED
jgi:hypothetical protein